MEQPGRTSKELVDLLGRLGLDAREGAIREDIRDGYLPHPDRRGQGARKGIVGFWPYWTVRRAVFLYRLRKRGLRGDLLRIFLFLRDGWGWQQVQPISDEGVRKMLAATTSPVRRHHRVVVDRAAVESDIPKYERHLERLGIGPLGEGDRQVNLVLWGQLLFGAPLSGASLRPLVDSLSRLGYPLELKDVAVAESALSSLHLTENRLDEIPTEAGASTWSQVHECTRAQVLLFRMAFRRHLRSQPRSSGPAISSNPWTFFGIPPQRLDEFLRAYPGRPTRAQFLAACLLPSILIHHLDRELTAAVGKVQDQAKLKEQMSP